MVNELILIDLFSNKKDRKGYNSYETSYNQTHNTHTSWEAMARI